VTLITGIGALVYAYTSSRPAAPQVDDAEDDLDYIIQAEALP
jgi:hypothetical protein